MTSFGHMIHLPNAEATAAFAAAIGKRLSCRDVILLSGPVGAGKTHFARALIQSILKVPDDVPSPTFTLIQTYDTDKGSLWHADLYRISFSSEIDELGLLEAFENAICLIEWPDRLGTLQPPNALSIEFFSNHDTRVAKLSWGSDRWAKIVQEARQDA